MVFLRIEREQLLKKLAIALIAVLAATFLTLAIPSLSDGGMYFLFLTAIIFATLLGDVRAGILAVALSLTANFTLLRYLDKWPRNLGEWTVFLAFGMAAGFTVLLCHVRAESEKARLEAEKRYRVIFEDAITGIYETTVDGRYITANPKLAEILGYDYADHVIDGAENLNYRFYVQEDRRKEFSRLVEENNHLAGFESEVFRKDGSKIWISENAIAVRNETSVLVGFLGTTIEITDRKIAEAELLKTRQELEEKVIERTAELEQANQVLRDEMAERQRVENDLMESEEKYRTLVETSTDFIWETDSRGFYTYVSPKIRDLVGFEPEEVLGKRPYDLMPPDEARRVKDRVLQLSAERRGHVLFESVQVHKNGSLITTETSSVPVYDDGGKLKFSRGIARDITNRKRIENELLASRTQLRDLTAYLQSVREDERKYIARELHDELGQKLTAVKIELTRMNDGGGKSRSPKILNSVGIPSVLHLVDAALETTRKIVSELRPAVLDELGLEAALEWQVQEFIKRTGISFTLEIDFNEDHVPQGAEITIFRILQECLTNITRHANAKHVNVVLKEEAEKLLLVVDDDGQGISDEEIGNPRSFGIVGMRERAILLGGSVRIDRRDADGTRVLVEIPSSTNGRAHS